MSLVSDSEKLLLRNVAGTLRVLLSFQVCGSETGLTSSFTDKVIARLFECMKVVSRVMVQQKSDDKLTMSSQDCFNPPSHRLWPLDCMLTVH